MKTKAANGSVAIQFKALTRAMILFALIGSAIPVLAESPAAEPPELATLRELFTLPDEEIDLGKAKLLIDHIIDPSVDVAATLAQLDAMTAEIRAALPPGAKSFDVVHYLRGYLYALGPWSGQTPFRYDLDDPLGNVFEHKLLHDYLASRKGNCVTMPLLFIILGQRLGLDVTASIAPNHIFVKYTDPDTSTTYNIEATDQGIATEEDFYVQATGISEGALENGLYLQPLTKKESLALMMTLLCEHYAGTEEWEQCMAVAEEVLQHYPKCVGAMLWMGSSYAKLMERIRYRATLGFSETQVEKLKYMSKQNEYWFTKAEALGWREPTQAEEEAYLESVRKRRDELQ